MLNHYLLIAKYHIFLTRNQPDSPTSLKVILALLENQIKCERQMAIKNSNYIKNEAKWTTLCICDAESIFPFLSSLQLSIGNPIFHVPIMKVKVLHFFIFLVSLNFFYMFFCVVYLKVLTI